ncbi:MAG: helix-turn-helix domain-containing protein [Myxococcaceae bacterium]|nr:helix-turn-helix domain-containing protein [Myxococcaceae bacterium]
MASLEQLLRVLARLRTAQAGELARQLGVSQPTVSRLIGSAGERVCRMGKGRATRYAATRELLSLGTRLPVHRILEDGRPELLGELHLLEGGGHWLERLLGQPAPAPEAAAPTEPEPWDALLRRLTGKDVTRCPQCGAGRFLIVEALRAVSGPWELSGHARSP